MLLSLACAPPPPPPEPQPPPPRTIQYVRAEAEALLRERLDLEWRRWALGETVNTSSVFAERQWLVEDATLDLVAEAIGAATDGDERRALSYLWAFLIGERMAKHTAALDDQISKIRLGSAVEINGQLVTYHQIRGLLANEPDHDERRRIAAAIKPVMVELNKLLERRRQATYTAARTLGHGNYIALSSAIRHFDVRSVAPLARQVLRESEAVYLEALAKMAPEAAGVEVPELRHADIPRLMKSPAFGEYFTLEQLFPAAWETVAGLGIDWRALGVTLDTRDTPGKNPRAGSFPVQIPNDIRVTVKPVGGATDYQALLHEIGHALNFAFTETEPFELQQLGDTSTAEGLAFLFDNLPNDPAWLEDKLQMPEPLLTECVRVAALKELYLLRRYAAKVLFELDLHGSLATGPAETVKASYAQHLSRAYGFPVEDVGAERYLIDHDAFFYSASYLRAWLIEAQLTEHLKRRFGEKWWTNPEAGTWLKGLWAPGQRITGEELAAAIGADGLTVDPILRRIAKHLAR